MFSWFPISFPLRHPVIVPAARTSRWTFGGWRPTGRFSTGLTAQCSTLSSALTSAALDLRSHAGALETAVVGTLDAYFLPHRRRRRMHERHDPADVAHPPHRNLIP